MAAASNPGFRALARGTLEADFASEPHPSAAPPVPSLLLVLLRHPFLLPMQLPEYSRTGSQHLKPHRPQTLDSG
jgi:hypothetical protein